jgi:chromosome segregation ATPase
MSPPEVTNIFDMSQRDLPPITADAAASLQVDAVEVSETDQSMDDETQHVPPRTSPTVSLPPKEVNQTVFHSMETSKAPSHDRSHSFSFGQAVFHPMPKANLEVLGSAPMIEPSPGRSRAVSESMYHTLSRANKNPELDINDPSPASIVLYATPYATPSADRVLNLSPSPPEPDPFRANATTFYTPGTLLPPSPPAAVLGHARKLSKDDDIIWSLRTQLAIQQELCSQYEVDLGARDMLVSVLTQRVENAEKESEKRRGVVRGWKKKVQELERLCRNLEEEVDRSREESMERSIMDEASGEALRQLHGHIAGLEREKGELVRNSLIFMDPSAKAKEMEEEVAKLREELRQRDEVEQELQEELRTAQEQIELLNTVGAMDDESRIVGITAASEEQERHRLAEEDWEKEREELRQEATKALAKKEEEVFVLRDELEAQWKNTERTGESMAQLKEERNVLQSEVVALEARIESMELEWNDADNRRSEAENTLHVIFAEKETFELEKAEVMSLGHLPLSVCTDVVFQLETKLADLRHHADHIASLQQDLKFANDSVARLQQDIRQRDSELEGLAHRIVAREDEAEDARAELAAFKHEHVRMADEHRLALVELTTRAEGTEAELGAAVQGKDDVDAVVQSLRERIGTLEAELEKLGKQVRDLQTESANKEVHIAQMEKQRDRDREDLQGLNIALDSKQQELELVSALSPISRVD